MCEETCENEVKTFKLLRCTLGAAKAQPNHISLVFFIAKGNKIKSQLKKQTKIYKNKHKNPKIRVHKDNQHEV